MNSTVNYYNTYAQEYTSSTIQVPVTDLVVNFCTKLELGSHILDVGCGSGRDSLYFLEQGFKVTALDNSQELAKLASKKIGQEVIVSEIQNINWVEQFDAVWAMASLLHLKKSDLPLALDKCSQALKTNGTFFAAFKIGHGEQYDEKGRLFSYYQPEELQNILEATGNFNNIKLIINHDSMGREVNWVSIMANRTPSLNNNILLKKNKI